MYVRSLCAVIVSPFDPSSKVGRHAIDDESGGVLDAAGGVLHDTRVVSLVTCADRVDGKHRGARS